MHPLEEKIVDKRRELGDAKNRLRAAQKDIAVIRAQIAAYKESLSYLSDISSFPAESKGRTPSDQYSAMWSIIMRDLLISGKEEFDYPDIVSQAQILGYSLKPGSTRNVTMDYVKRGLLERVKNGRFKFSEQAHSEIIGGNEDSDFDDLEARDED